MSSRQTLQQTLRGFMARKRSRERSSELSAAAHALARQLRIIVGDLALLDATELEGELSNLFDLRAILRDTGARLDEVLRSLSN